jgi:hypothetical protein
MVAVQMSDMSAIEKADRVRLLCNAIRSRTNNYTVDIKHWLYDMGKLNECGWSSDALPMLQLANDIKELRELADAMEDMHCTLILPKPERKPEHA